MRISIVTISYNQARYLERAIYSVISQNYPDIEYIIVDPGSTDGSRRIIQHYADRIHKIIFEPDRGPADGLNKGFLYATGAIFGYLNSDDMYLPNTFKKISDLFLNHSEADVIYGHSLIIDSYGKTLRRSFSDNFDLKAFAYGACQIMQPSAFFRSSIWKKTNGFNINNSSNWDSELWHDIYNRGGVFINTNQFFSYYRVHSQSITGSKKLDLKIRDYSKNKFYKIMGRDWNNIDFGRRLLWLFRKYLLKPISLFERIRFGPVYGMLKRK